MKIGRLTLSDRASAGVYEDLSGPEIERHVTSVFSGETIVWIRELLADDQYEIEKTLIRLCDDEQCDLVLTTGGTGPTKRDVTPEATRAILEKELPGFGEIMRVRTFDQAPTSILSRATAGIRGRTLIVNLPGRPEAVGECVAVFSHALKKTMALMRQS